MPDRSQRFTRVLRHATLTSLVIPLVSAVSLAIGAGAASGAVIPVTTLAQKISESSGCSLQEAIYSANFDSNTAIRYSGSTPIPIMTECVPGSGDDIIVLPAGGLLRLSEIIDDANNPSGATATPLITSNITILAYGATLERIGNRNFRLFAVGSTGHLTIRRAYIRGFRAQGGKGGGGGGGGLGAGGAIIVMGGTLDVDASTLASNSASGGEGGSGNGGGGGGMGGNGGTTAFCRGGGGGGGGARGSGGICGNDGVEGGGGGGTIASAAGTPGGYNCGANGGHGGGGHNAPCAGGGGGGAGDTLFRLPGEDGSDGGRGNYGGGGGGGTERGEGGHGGFGGGGGASGLAGAPGEDGGNGGLGGGGGAGNDGYITDGDPGNGGFFAGSGSSTGGGGGAGLGGAIFNHGGTVDIRNSTFTANGVNGGFSERTQDGSGGGGAIYSVNGHLTVLNSTISGNTANFGGGIIVAQVSETDGGIFGDDSELAPTSFVLENTIIAGNGQYECAITGTSIGIAFVGNLIRNNVADGTRFHREEFVGCGGVVTSSDAQLGPLQYNQGVTPTMAISAVSPARNAADPVTSLTVDQRRQPRPANGGYDIGAFELCLDGPPIAQMPCVILAGIDPGHAVNLTIDAQPTAGGTTIPAPGTQQVEVDSVVALRAVPNPGYRFAGWSANVTNPPAIATTVFMSASQTVTAYFAACACASDSGNSIAVTLRDVPNNAKGPDVWLATITNISPVTVAGPISLVLDRLPAGVTVTNATGSTSLMLPGGSPYLNAAALSLRPGQSFTLPVLFAKPDGVAITYDTRVLVGPGGR